MGRDSSNRVYPDSGVTTGFHPASHHHGARGLHQASSQQINSTMSSMIPYFLEKLKSTPDGDGNLLDTA